MAKKQSQAEREEQAFLDAIATEPDEEAHRLVFSDWLEDRDDPRAEWVRDADIWPWMAPDAGDPIPRLLDALAEETIGEARFLAVQQTWDKLGTAGVPPLRKWVREAPDERFIRTWVHNCKVDVGIDVSGSLLERRPAELRSVEELTQILTSEDWYEVWQAIVDLGFHGPKASDAVEAMLGTFDHRGWDNFYDWEPDHPHRRALFRSLSEMGEAAKPAIPVMAEMAWLSPYAREALRKLRADAFEVLEHINDDEDDDTRTGLCLVRDLDPTTTSALLHAARTKTGRKRNLAIELLGELGEVAASTVPTLIEIVREDQTLDVRRMLSYLATALVGIGEAAREAMPALLEERDVFETGTDWEAVIGRCEVARCLAVFGYTEEAVAMLTPHLTGGQEHYRNHTIDTLAKIQKEAES